MENKKKTEEIIFDKYFDNMNLNEELKDFYRFMDDKVLYNEYTENVELTNLRNENYNRFSDLDVSKIKNLPNLYDSLVNEINKLYNILQSQDLFYNDIDEANDNKKIIDLFIKYFEQLEEVIKLDLYELEKTNNERQNNIIKIDYNKLDNKITERVFDLYNEIVYLNFESENNIFDNYKIQLERKKYIDELYKLLYKEKNTELPQLALKKLNTKINQEKNNLYNKLLYLEDLMLEKSKYEKEFIEFKNYITKLFAYDDTNYKDLCNIYETLFINTDIKEQIDYFESSFIDEQESLKREEKFIYEKFGIKNIRSSLDYIFANYIDSITEEEKKLVNELYNEINNNNYDINEMYNKLSYFVNNIWKRSITNIKSYKKEEPFNFICTNNEFIDEKHEAILITDKMLNKVNSYSDYQIGFICEFNENILYITENENIMSVEHDDMSKLKTPKQIEQEFLNFKVCNRIALNGYITRIVAVYFIYDGDIMKYGKANQLAKQYNLPLIELKKDKFR